ncbi:hypothetical protein TELCIR_16344 [Teladorsagia circumcincta]|uniref:Uncharacterized protein n=1 Tax=Teladorsagia circumcincta TaxID=45464 RepID=A0A2G9TVS0_TELCI|nr:hypothetical protein TELCIR_16344 [Teladorsagia circumcincta]
MITADKISDMRNNGQELLMTHAAEESTSSTSQFFSGHTPADHPNEEPDTSTAKIADLIKSLTDEKLNVFFHIEDTVRWIQENGYKRVALQLPDHFLVRAARIAQTVESKANVKVFILADTSYRRFIFGSFPVDLTTFGKVRNYLSEDTTPVLLLTDAHYSEKIDELEKTIRHFIPEERQLFRANLVDPSQRDISTENGDMFYFALYALQSDPSAAPQRLRRALARYRCSTLFER